MARKNLSYHTHGTLLFCVWLDAFSEDEWTNRESLDIRPCEIHSAGICIEHTKEFLTLGLNHDTINDNFSCYITVPTGMILSIQELKIKGEK